MNRQLLPFAFSLLMFGACVGTATSDVDVTGATTASAGGATSGAPGCTPGASVSCVGPAGCDGLQACNLDGESFGTCICTPVTTSSTTSQTTGATPVLSATTASATAGTTSTSSSSTTSGGSTASTASSGSSTTPTSGSASTGGTTSGTTSSPTSGTLPTTGSTPSTTTSGTTAGATIGTTSGASASSALLQITPVIQDFGSISLGQTSATTSFVVTNVGGGTSTALVVILQGANSADFASGLSDGCNGTALAPNAQCTVQLAFTPGLVGSETAQLRVVDVASDLALATLDGTGVSATPKSPAQLGSTSLEGSFGSQVDGTHSSPITFTLTNEGETSTSALTDAVTGQNAGDFAIQSDGCSGTVLAPNGSCQLSVVFTAKTAGAETATLAVVDTAADTLDLSLTGSGTTVTNLSLSPATASFGTVPDGDVSVVQFRITNTGAAAANDLSLSFTGPNAADFTVGPPLGGTSCVTTTSLAAGATCRFSVTFAPRTTSAETASLNGTATGISPPTTASLSGTGTAAIAACGSSCSAASSCILSDVENCGACGNACAIESPATAACVLGRCLYQLASSPTGEIGVLATDSTNLYYTVNSGGFGQVMQVPLAGGAPTTLVSQQNVTYYAIGVTGSDVYWSSSAGINSVPIGGGLERESTVMSGTSTLAFNVSSAGIDFAGPAPSGQTGGAFYQLSLDLTTLTTLTYGDIPQNPNGMVATASNIYYSDATGIDVLALNHSAAQVVDGVDGAAIEGIVTDGTSVYFAAPYTFTTVESLTASALTSNTLPPPPNDVNGQSLQIPFANAMAIDAANENLYLGCTDTVATGGPYSNPQGVPTNGSIGAIAKLPTSGDSLEILVDDLGAAPTSIAVDATNVYFSTANGIYVIAGK